METLHRIGFYVGSPTVTVVKRQNFLENTFDNGMI